MSLRVEHRRDNLWQRRGRGALTPPGAPAGTVLWDGSLEGVATGTEHVLRTASTLFLAEPWPYSSIQLAGNTASAGAVVTVDGSVTRNSRHTRSLRMVMDAGSQRCQPTSRGPAGRWTADAAGTVDRWYGWSMRYGTDWGDSTTNAGRATLDAEISGTNWHDPIAFRTAGTNGSMNMSGDHTDEAGNSTPRTLYLRRNTVLNNSGFYTDGKGLDKIPAGQIVTDRWMDFVVNVRWSTTSNNALRRVFRDGVFMGSSATLNAVDTLEHALRVGIYQNTTITHPRTAWFDNVRIGTSYAAVDPSVV